MKNVAVLTSGGDAAGMNAAIRAVVRTGCANGLRMFGVSNGFQGLLESSLRPMRERDVGGIIQLGGTMLGSARSKEFKSEAGLKRALGILEMHEIDALVVIGGNGSQTGAYSLSREGFPVVGIASTIDNDLYGSEMTLGVDTALNIALEAIDRLKVTASSHQRAFLVEVMGRDCGYLALMSAIAGGAETVAIPEIETDPDEIAQTIAEAYERGKTHALVVVAEGAKYNAEALAVHFKEHRDEIGFDLRVTTLGHVQRGGTPGAFDRLLASRFGVAAVESLLKKETGVLVGLQKGDLSTTPLSEVAANRKKLDTSLLEVAGVLAR